jgi:hypothetical protein
VPAADGAIHHHDRRHIIHDHDHCPDGDDDDVNGHVLHDHDEGDVHGTTADGSTDQDEAADGDPDESGAASLYARVHHFLADSFWGHPADRAGLHRD